MKKNKNSKGKIIPEEKSFFEKHAWWMIGGIILLTFFLYWNSLKGDFLNYDDTENVVNNVQIQHLNFTHFFTTSNLYMYSPLTFISYALDYKIDGLHPYFFKLANLILHLINVIFVFVFSNKLLKKKNLSILITLLFAMHPINVDTVSWISTRSNLLCTMFFLLSLILYFIYLEKNNYLYLILSIIACCLSLLSKSTAVMLPFVLLGIDYFRKRKMNLKLILEKAPYFILCLAVGLLAIYFRTDSGTTQNITNYNLFDRILIICYSLLAYIIRAVFPFHLSEIYGYPVKVNGFLPLWYYISPIIILLIVFAIYKMKSLKREIIFGIFFFLATIIITQIAMLEDGFTADRYTYLPFIGIYFIIAVAYDYFSSRFHKIKIILRSVFLILLFFFSILTYQRSLVWMNTLTLFNHAIEQSPDAAFAYNSRGIAKFSGNDFDGALIDYNAAIKFNPSYSGAFYNRGIVFYATQDYEKALNDYSKAIELNPNFASAYSARGILEMDILKNDSLAIIDYNKAILINPTFAQAFYNRGIAELRMNDKTKACNDFWTVKNMGYSQADDLIDQNCH